MRQATALLVVTLVANAGWKESAQKYLEAYRSYFFGGRGNSTAGFERLSALEADVAHTVASYDQLRDALVGPDALLREAAIARLAAGAHTDPSLASLLIEHFPREEDPAVRQLSLLGMEKAGREWARRHGRDIARALALERNPNVATVAALGILQSLDMDDLLSAAAALALNGDETNRKVLYGAVYLRESGAGLQALAELLRRNGRSDLGAEAEKYRADSEPRGGE
jgi:hypothetical protein